MVHRAAEGHKLRLDPRKLRKRPHGVEHFLQKAAADIRLRKTRGDVQSSDQAFLLFQNVERISRRRSVFERHAAAERMRVQKTSDEVERAAVIPVQFVVPVARLFLEKRLKLPHAGLAKVENIHGRKGAPQRSFMIADSPTPARKGPAARVHHRTSATDATQPRALAHGPRKPRVTILLFTV